MNTTPAERRERYKAAMRNVRMLRDGKNQDRQADAVAAVADDEITDALGIADAAHDAKVRELEADNARLRKEAAEVRAAALEEEADRIDRTDLPQDHVDVFDNGARWVTAELRRTAAQLRAAAARPDNTGA